MYLWMIWERCHEWWIIQDRGGVGGAFKDSNCLVTLGKATENPLRAADNIIKYPINS
jgi:hypothetical protein